jgi:hypothetical protein
MSETFEKKHRGCGYVLSAMGIAGNLLITFKEPIPAFMIWTVANLGWIVLIIRTKELKEQLPMWVAYTLISVAGLVNWAMT